MPWAALAGTATDQLFGTWIYDAVFVLAAVACLAHAVRHRERRFAAVALGTGLLLFTAGNLIYSLAPDVDAVPVPSISDPLWLAIYPCEYISADSRAGRPDPAGHASGRDPQRVDDRCRRGLRLRAGSGRSNRRRADRGVRHEPRVSDRGPRAPGCDRERRRARRLAVGSSLGRPCLGRACLGGGGSRLSARHGGDLRQRCGRARDDRRRRRGRGCMRKSWCLYGSAGGVEPRPVRSCGVRRPGARAADRCVAAGSARGGHRTRWGGPGPRAGSYDGCASREPGPPRRQPVRGHDGCAHRAGQPPEVQGRPGKGTRSDWRDSAPTGHARPERLQDLQRQLRPRRR